MKLTDMIISAILKRGIVYEARNVDTTFDIPVVNDGQEKIIKIQLKTDHMCLMVNKEEV